MKTISLGIAAWCGLALAAGHASSAADSSGPDQAGEIRSGDWAFTLAPRPWQRQPLLDMTALTEFTAAGRMVGPASQAHPIYYVAQNGGVINEGGTYTRERRPSAETVQKAVTRALLSTGYVETTGRSVRPRIAIVYHYGSFNPLPEGISDLGNNFLLSRAKFIAGQKFSEELAHKLFLGAAVQFAIVPNLTLAPDQGPGGMPPDAAAFFDPVYLMRTFHPKDNALLSQLEADLYYVAISAYDYDALAHNRRVLLWRTNLTVDATGLAMDDSLPALIVGSGAYVGQPTPDVAVFARRVNQMGRVDVGTPHPVD